MWLPYLYARWLFWFVVGIVWEIKAQAYTIVGWHFFVLSAIGYGIAHFFLPLRWRVHGHWVLGILSSFVLVGFGVLYTHSRTERHHLKHFLHQTNIEGYTATIVQEPQEKTRSYRAVGEVSQIRVKGKWQASKGKVLLYFRKSSGKLAQLQYGNVYIIKGSPQAVPPPSNPKMFDFSEYLAYQNVYHQQFLTAPEVKLIGHKIPDYFLYVAIYLRQRCMRIFDEYVLGGQESALATALVLGIKDEVDADILDAYTVTGLMHILAVSGMHVGLLVWLPMRWFRRVQDRNDTKTKRKKYIFLGVIIALLAFYALLTGLSASISRAVVMFSILLAGKVWRKRSSPYNILALSAFLLLLWEPYWILNVGFQLSYLAVLGIFYIQPRLDRWITPRTWFMREVWGMVTVTIAAQIATTPISLFYFHQFPNYFLISNLIALPLSTGVLYTVLALLLFWWIPYLNVFLGYLASCGIWLTNQVIFYIRQMPAQLSDGIWIEWWEVVLLYGFVVFFLATWELHRTRYWAWAFACLAIFTASRTARYLDQNRQEIWVVYNTNKMENMAFLQGHKAYIMSDSLAKSTKEYKFNLECHLFSQGIAKPTYVNAQTTLPFRYQAGKGYQWCEFAGKTFLVLSKDLPREALPTLSKVKADFCLIAEKGLYSLQDLPTDMRVGKFIVSASIPKSYAQRLKREADSLRVPMHVIAEQGAFVWRRR